MPLAPPTGKRERASRARFWFYLAWRKQLTSREVATWALARPRRKRRLFSQARFYSLLVGEVVRGFYPITEHSKANTRVTFRRSIESHYIQNSLEKKYCLTLYDFVLTDCSCKRSRARFLKESVISAFVLFFFLFFFCFVLKKAQEQRGREKIIYNLRNSQFPSTLLV